MPTTLFFDLAPEKQQTIIVAGISEFAHYGYENSSTNRIVKKAGIGKGSLFKYFPTKEDFYFHVLDMVTAEMIASLQEGMGDLSPEPFQRILDYAALEFSWYMLDPDKAAMIIKAFTKSDTTIYQKTLANYGHRSQAIYYRSLQDADLAQFRWDKQKTLDLLNWFLKGFNERFLTMLQTKEYDDLAKTKTQYITNLSEYMDMLKKGLVK